MHRVFLMLLILVWPLGTAEAARPPERRPIESPKPAPAPAGERARAPVRPSATPTPAAPRPEPTPLPAAAVKLLCDIECEAEVDGVAVAVFAAGAPQTLELEPGQHLLRLSNSEHGCAWETITEATRGAQKIVKVVLKPTCSAEFDRVMA